MLILFEVREINHEVEKIGVCILLEKNIGPPTEAMFSWWKFQVDKILKNLKWDNIIVEC